jgi:hypothetical protein
MKEAGFKIEKLSRTSREEGNVKRVEVVFEFKSLSV